MTEKFTSPKNQYEVISKHAEGGFGTTYRVRRQADQKEYLLKKLHLAQAGDWKAVELFEREASFLSNLSHPRIPRCIDSFYQESGGNFFLVQDFIEGRTLQEHITQRTPLPLNKYLDYLKQSLEILEFLHSLVPPAIHRDVSPKNLIVTPDGRVFLVDFGSVKSALLAQTNMTSVGTFGFMAPEQTMGQPQTASDLYSLGMTFIALAAQADPSQLPLDPNTGRIDIRKVLSLPGWVIGLLESMTQPGVASRIGSARLALARLAKGEDKPAPKPQTFAPAVVRQTPNQGSWLWLFILLPLSIGYLFYSGSVNVDSKNPLATFNSPGETKIERLERECTAKIAESCTSAGYQYSNSKETPHDYDKSFQFYKQGCDLNDYLGCNNLGTMYENGHGTPKNEARAVELYYLACSQQIPLACNNLALAHRDGIGVPANDVTAAQYFQQGCDLKYGASCNSLGYLYERGKTGAIDLPRAVALYQEACSLKDALGCNNLGLCYQDAIGVTQDYAIASEYFIKGCDLDNGSACNSLGILYEEGKGVVPDDSKAANYYTRGCELGTMASCSNLGYLYNYGKGAPKDQTKAFNLYKKSCDGGNVLGCNNLGSMYLNGNGIEKDFERAFTLFESACNQKEALACSNLAAMYKSGQHVKADPKKAKELYKQACDGGNTSSCEPQKK
jgi:TPR repeat protein